MPPSLNPELTLPVGFRLEAKPFIGTRRQFLRRTFFSAGGLGAAALFSACGGGSGGTKSAPFPTPTSTPTPPPPTTLTSSPASPPAPVLPKNPFAQMSALRAADANGVMLVDDFCARIVARSG